MITLMMSGHCNTAHLNRVPSEAHARCQMVQCPCACHYQGSEQYECGCGETLVEAHWENTDPDDPDPAYTHLAHDGSAIGEMCP